MEFSEKPTFLTAEDADGFLLTSFVPFFDIPEKPNQDPGLLAVARGCPKLEKLMLTGCGGITGKSVRALARGCSALRDLSLSGCGGVGNGDLKELARGCTNLRHLNIAECAQVTKACR